ncbi:MAG: hypothetical protein H6872_14740 [Methylobacteriaceae bacterium]|nr:hypothetical protein [Methylobacteriaceae bacterium]
MPYVIAFIIAVAAFMGWRAMQPDCPGGAIVADAQQCRTTFGENFCAKAMPEALAIARRGGGSFPTQAACLDQYPACIERSDIAAWTPRPASYCLARGADGEVARAEPRYAIR